MSIHQTVREIARNRTEAVAGDAEPSVLIVRDGRIIAVVEGPDPNDLLAQVPMAAVGYGADAVAFCFEGVVPRVETNPLTGQGWQRGEAEQVRLENDGVARGWVSDVLVVAYVGRDGSIHTSAQNFAKVDGVVTWDSENEQPGGVGAEPILQQALEQPALDAAQVPDPGDSFVAPEGAPMLSAEDGRLMLDIGCTRIVDGRLPENSRAAFVARDEDEARVLVQQGLMDWQVVLV